MAPRIQISRRTGFQLLAAFFLMAAGLAVRADLQTNRVFAARAEAEYHREQQQLQADTNNPAAGWQFARACFDFAEFATNDTERATLPSRASPRAANCSSGGPSPRRAIITWA